jgi:peptide/nickel transport system substrate-binding protein
MRRRTFILGALLSGGAGLAPRTLQAARQSGTVRRLNVIAQPEPSLLILGLNLQASTQMVAGKIYQGLLTYDEQLRPRPELAKSWEVSDDRLTYKFELQEDVVWHDGHPFEADDVVFTTKEFLPAVHPIARYNFNWVAEVSAPSPHTVIFTLREPYAPFIMAFAVGSAPMMPKHIYAGTDYWKNPANATPIGTGPFKFHEWKKGRYIHLINNGSYWKLDRPQLDEIYFHVIPDSASRVIALEDSVVDLTSFTDIEPVEIPHLKADPRLSVTTKGYEFYSPLSWIEINHRVGALSDKRLRQAILCAVNRDFIAKQIFFGQAKVATGPISSTMRFYDASVPSYAFDPKRAERLLDDMGMKRDSSGRRMSLKLLGLPYGEAWSRIAEYIKQSLESVGIGIVLEVVDAAGWAQRVANWDYELALDYVYQLGDPAIGVARTYVSSSIRKGILFTNTMGYSNPAVDRLFALAAVEKSDDERQKLYSQVQNVLVDDVPVAWLVELQFPTVFDRRLRNVVTSAIGVNDTFDSTYWANT